MVGEEEGQRQKLSNIEERGGRRNEVRLAGRSKRHGESESI
jgi:hypothetical protein